MFKKEVSPLIRTRSANAYWGTVSAFMGVAASSVMALAATSDIWGAAKDALSGIYSKILMISTAVAVVCLAIALILRMISRNQRVVDEATQWIKRIIITYLILNGLGFVFSYINSLGFNKQVDLAVVPFIQNLL